MSQLPKVTQPSHHLQTGPVTAWICLDSVLRASPWCRSQHWPSGWTREDQELRGILRCTVSSRPAWVACPPPFLLVDPFFRHDVGSTLLSQVLLRGARPRTHGLRRDPQSAVMRDSQDHSAEQLWAEHNGKERELLAGRPGWAQSPSCPLGQEGSQSPAEEPHGARYF